MGRLPRGVLLFVIAALVVVATVQLATMVSLSITHQVRGNTLNSSSTAARVPALVPEMPELGAGRALIGVVVVEPQIIRPALSPVPFVPPRA